MSTGNSEASAALASAAKGTDNPSVALADTSPTAPARKARIPMSLPRRKLETSKIPGYRLYWFHEHQIPAAEQAGYEPVLRSEVSVNGVSLTGTMSANSDLGSGVKIVASQSTGECLVLMKIKEEYFHEDQRAIAERNAKILSSIFTKERIMGEEKMEPGDRALSYVSQASIQTSTPVFLRPRRK